MKNKDNIIARAVKCILLMEDSFMAILFRVVEINNERFESSGERKFNSPVKKIIFQPE
jgi:hypothetical protein